MKRRGFLGWVLGAGAAPAAAVVASQLDAFPKELIEPDPSFEPLPREISGGYGYTEMYSVMMPVSTGSREDYYKRHNIKTCVHCGGREFVGYVYCRHCHKDNWE